MLPRQTFCGAGLIVRWEEARVAGRRGVVREVGSRWRRGGGLVWGARAARGFFRPRAARARCGGRASGLCRKVTGAAVVSGRWGEAGRPERGAAGERGRGAVGGCCPWRPRGRAGLGSGGWPTNGRRAVALDEATGATTVSAGGWVEAGPVPE
ncbi:hypothetical protein [Hymenobacter profundi]|uniref:Uncharacterized protein n=1 Tax=Hymenobacter profundi TaxID=1982110 RepID=A0ABS6WUN0_9BACT|nr:hypothetical protein [Hymenobacter profundi]MBW3127283.1 hypothetical protein [Hymenobacter profundi]